MFQRSAGSENSWSAGVRLQRPDSLLHWVPRSGRPPNLGGLSVWKTLHLVADIAEGYNMF